MSSAISELRKKSQALSSSIKQGEINSRGGGGGQDDPRFWYPKLDKDGLGYGLIRFLPATKGCDLPWSLIRSHKFQTPNGWFIENCLTTIDQECPVCKANSVLWNSGIEANKKIASGRKRKITYYTNVLVINDPTAPENNGKVKILKMGSQMFEMILAAAKPKFPGETPVDAFDPFETGANFEFKIYKADGNVKYDRCCFKAPAPMGDDQFIEAIWEQQHDLRTFADKSQFKDPEAIKSAFNRKIGEEASRQNGPSEPQRDVSKSEPPSRAREETDSSPPFETGNSDSDDTMSFFKNLGNT